MSATKLPKTEQELRSLLEQALEAGQQMGPRKPGASAPPSQLPAEPIVDKRALQGQFNERFAALKTDPRKSPLELRQLQAEFIEKGLTEQEVDTTNYSKASDPRENDLNSPAAWRYRGRR